VQATLSMRLDSYLQLLSVALANQMLTTPTGGDRSANQPVTLVLSPLRNKATGKISHALRWWPRP